MSTLMIVLLCVAGFFGLVAGLICLLLFARVHLTVSWREQLLVRVRFLIFIFPIYPEKVRWRHYTVKNYERERRKFDGYTEQIERATASDAQADDAEEGAQTPYIMRRNLRLLRSLLSVLVRYTTKDLRLDVTRIRLHVARGDAATTALAYGMVSTSLEHLLAALDQVMHVNVKRDDVIVTTDYLSEQSHADVKLRFSYPSLLQRWLTTIRENNARKKRRAAQAKRKQTVTPTASPAQH